jgi:pyruvate kinase
MRRNRRAKIVATLGPASSDATIIRRLFEAGVDVFRLNFSHGSKEDHASRYEIIRRIERELGRPIAILQDLQGPKIRIGTLGGGKAMLQVGAVVRFDSDKQPGDQSRLPLLHPEVYQAIAPGHQVLINDGRVRLEVIGCGSTHFDARVMVGGEVSDRKGVNLPDTLLQLSPITAKDRADLEFGLSLGVDFVALSFVQQPSDVIEGRSLIGDRAALMVKIEKPAALKRIKEIIQLADAVMVARGDLGVEIPAEDVPGWQKDIVRECRMAGKPVIIATQMLESMIQSPTPTRAEASDVATGVYDGADAVMLSAESASGAFPLEAVAMMDRIISHTENHGAYRSIIDALEPSIEGTVSHAVSAAAAEIADRLGAAAMVAFTSSGNTASRVARQRSRVPIVGVTPNEKSARQLALLWGVHSVKSEEIGSFREMVERAAGHARNEGYAKRGDNIVVIAGVPFGQAGTTNNIRVLSVS